jgi:hypothetical protein
MSPLRRLQKASLNAVERSYTAAGDKIKTGAAGLTKALRAVDRSVGITRALAKAGTTIHEAGAELDGRFDVSGKASQAARKAANLAARGANAVARAAQDAGVTGTIHDNVMEPAKSAYNAIRQHDATTAALSKLDAGYGSARSATKELFAPSFVTYDSRELFLQTKKELEYVAACIMQISADDSSAIASQFGRAVASKIAGTATAGGVVALAASLGTAGTGTPIAMLTGAAATKASLAWIGSLVGGGVAAGTALTGGVAFVAGLAAYRALRSERRDFAQLSAEEQRVVQACWLFASFCDELSRQQVVARETLEELFRDGLLPLYQELRDHAEALTANLDAKHTVAFRQHMLHDYADGVVRRFSAYLSWRHSAQGEAWEAAVRVEPGEAPAAARLDNSGTRPSPIIGQVALAKVISTVH